MTVMESRRALAGSPKLSKWRQRIPATDAGGKFAGPRREYRPPRGIIERMLSALNELWKGRVDVPEEALEHDPEFPASAVRIEEHPHGAAWCGQQVRLWRAAGFLPVAVSRLVGLRPVDCARCARKNKVSAAAENHAHSPYEGPGKHEGGSGRCGRAHNI